MTSEGQWPTPAHQLGEGSVVEHRVLEREVKLAVSSLEPVETRLRALDGKGARFIRTIREQNYVLDTARDELKARDERLRIRDIEGQPGVLVTWKGPASVRNGLRRREEREFHANDREACVAVLSNLGLRPIRSYEKVRSSWSLHNMVICLDTLSFGSFVEIEFTPDISEQNEVAALEEVVALLGLEAAPRVQASYARLQQEWNNMLQKYVRKVPKVRR